MLENRALLAAAFTEFVDPNPSVDNGFGVEIVPLSTGNVVITSPYDDAGGTDAGAVYLFNGATGELISTLTGSQANDRIGLGSFLGAVTPLTNGNYLITSVVWNNGSVEQAGAVTFGNGVTGVSGMVSSDNSLVGSVRDQVVGATLPFSAGDGVVPLPNGDYVVTSIRTPNGSVVNAGSVTHGNGTTGTPGVISATNSLVGTRENDKVGIDGLRVLTNGNYVISSSGWDSEDFTDAGAVTFVNADVGLTGTIDETNSLVGGYELAQLQEVTVLTNGNYVVSQFDWRNAAGDTVGAATLADGTIGITGLIDPAKSLTGSTDGDSVSGFGATALTNGNYIVASPGWDNGELIDAGAVTWQSGTAATGAIVSADNSLVGGTAVARVGNAGVTPLTNENAVIQTITSGVITSTFINGATGANGVVSSENSLIFDSMGSTFRGRNEVTALPNGNYLVTSFADLGGHETTGALTLGDGVTGVSGVLSGENSLFGVSPSVSTPVKVLTNSNYVEEIGRNLYFGSGTVPATAQFSNDDAISLSPLYLITHPLTNGNFVIESGGGRDNTYLVDGSVGLSGELPVEGRILGSNVRPLLNGNYVLTAETTHQLLVGDGENPGVHAAVTSRGFDGIIGFAHSRVTSVSEDGNFISLNFGYDLDGTVDGQDVGSINFVDGSPNFASGFATTNFFVGSRAGFTQNVGVNNWETVTDEVNQHFYVGFSADGISRVVAGSTINGFANTTSGPDVNLSVSSSSGAESDETQITVTAAAASAVSGDQTILLVANGTGITSDDFLVENQFITIPDGQTVGSVTLTIRRDYEVEGTESLTLSLANPSTGIQLGTTVEQTISITDSAIEQLGLNDIPQFPTDTTPTFAWNDVGATRYEVWLEQRTPNHQRLQAANRFVTGSTSYTSNDVLASGTYRMWVRVNETNGNRSPWVPSAVFEYGATKPMLVSPLSTVATPRPTFTWVAVPGAQSYQIWIGTTTERIIESNIVGTSWTPSEDLPAGNIRWWIRKTAFTNGGWSNVGTASVGTASVGGTATISPTTVLTPSGSGTDTTPTFTWGAIAGSSRYILHVQNRTTGEVAIRENNLTIASFTPATALASGDFRVWVKAIGSSGSFTDGTWSSFVDFTIAAVTEDTLDTSVPRLASLPELVPTTDIAAFIQTVSADVATTNHLAIAPREGQIIEEVDAERAAAETNRSESLLSLLWQQEPIEGLLLTGESH